MTDIYTLEQADNEAREADKKRVLLERIRLEAPDLVEQVNLRKISHSRAIRIIRNRKAEQQRSREAQEEAALAGSASVDLRLGDFRTVLADLENVSAVITDPPYGQEYVPLLADLAEWADKVLAPDGVLAVLYGQTWLPEAYEALSGHLPYRWTACFLTLGNGYTAHHREVQSQWKPVLVYGGGPRFMDVFRSEDVRGDVKDQHRWGQDENVFREIVARFTKPGQTVADPFMGSGTTLRAAWSQGRHVAGCDIDEVAVATARQRFQLST